MVGRAEVDELLGCTDGSGTFETAFDHGDDTIVPFPARPAAPVPDWSGRSPINLKELLETLELERIQMALDLADGVVSEAARLLTLKRTTLIGKMRKYALDRCA